MTAAKDHLQHVARNYSHRHISAHHDGDPRVVRLVDEELDAAAIARVAELAGEGRLEALPKWLRDLVARCLDFVVASEALQESRIERPGFEMASGDVALLDERWRLATNALHRETYQVAREVAPAALTTTGQQPREPESHGKRRNSHG